MDDQKYKLCECGHLDNAVPGGSPWSHVRFHYGQLLGVEDFNQEQMAHIHGKQIRNALLHGSGTVWGLKVKEHENLPGVLAVEPGLAIDALGREIYLPEEFCLDVSRIVETELWGELETVEPQPLIKKRAFVIIRFQQCLSHRIPAIAPPCSQDDQVAQYARINDSFHISLEKTSPPDPHHFQRQWMSQSDPNHQIDWKTLRDRLLDFIISSTPVALSDFWQILDEAPLLLAEVTFQVQNGQLAEIKVNNSIRALLPSVQLIAEQLLGQRLIGRDERGPLKVIAIAATYHQNKMSVNIEFNLPVAQETVTPQNAAVNIRHDGDPWRVVDFDRPPDFNNNCVTLNSADSGEWQDETIYQVFLNGADDKPIVSKSGNPLMGWWDEPINTEGRGRNVSIVRQWK